MPHSPPLPVGAAYFTIPDRVEVTFDRLLVDAPLLDVPNWTVVLAGIGRVVGSAAALGHVVTLIMGPGGAANAINHVSFAPPPFDVIGRNGVAAPSFTAFPIT